MIHKCSFYKSLEVFFKEPTRIHFIREVSKKINIAQTSTRNNIHDLKKNGLINEKKSVPFDGFVANRENEEFIALKQSYNLYSIYEFKKKVTEECAPKAMILFGSYLRGEDIETSDIDLILVSKTKSDINVQDFEKKLGRKINITFVKDINELDSAVRNNLKNGLVIQGSLE